MSLDGLPDMLGEDIKKTLKSDLDALSVKARRLEDLTPLDAAKFVLSDKTPEKLGASQDTIKD